MRPSSAGTETAALLHPARALCATLAGALALAACSLFGPDLRGEGASGEAVEIAQVPFFPQTDYQGGPAALAMVLAAQGLAVTPEQLLREVYVPGRDGSVATPMIAATGARGLVPYSLRSGAEVAHQVQGGHPVLVLQKPKDGDWRFAVVIGVDPAHNRFVLRSGNQERRESKYREFLTDWADGGNWALAALRPDEIPPDATPQSWVKAVQALEQLRRFELAERAYAAASLRWPKDLLVWESLANARHSRGDLIGASQGFMKALELAPQEAVARNNLAYVLLERRCAEQAETQINLALAAETDPAQAAIYQRTRALILDYSGPSIMCPGL